MLDLPPFGIQCSLPGIVRPSPVEQMYTKGRICRPFLGGIPPGSCGIHVENRVRPPGGGWRVPVFGLLRGTRSDLLLENAHNPL